MSITARTVKGQCKISVDGDLTIYTVAEAKRKLLPKLAKCESMELDLSQVTELDTAGFQLLMSLKRTAAKRDVSFTISDESFVVREVTATYWVSEQLEPLPASNSPIFQECGTQ